MVADLPSGAVFAEEGDSRSSVRFLFIVIAATVLAVSVIASKWVCATQASTLSPEVLAAVFEGNSSLIGNVRYSMEYSYETSPEGLQSLLAQTSRGGKSPADATVEMEERGVLFVMDTRQKIKVEMRRYGAKSGHLLDHTVKCWNGELFKSYAPLTRDGIVSRERPTMDGLRLENLGLYIGDIPFHEYIRNKRTILGGDSLVISDGGHITKVYFDPSQDYWPHMIEHYQNGILRLRFSDIKARKFPVAGGEVYFPVSARYENFVLRSGEEGEIIPEAVPLTTGRVQLTDVEFNVSFAEDEFEVEFPLGTHVMDMVVGTHSTAGVTPTEATESVLDEMLSKLAQHVGQIGSMAAEGKPAAASESAPPLQQQPTGQQRGHHRRWGIGLGFLVLFLGVIGLGVFVGRRSGRSK